METASSAPPSAMAAAVFQANQPDLRIDEVMPAPPRPLVLPPLAAGFDFTVSNVPGVQVPQYLAGHRLLDTVGTIDARRDAGDGRGGDHLQPGHLPQPPPPTRGCSQDPGRLAALADDVVDELTSAANLREEDAGALRVEARRPSPRPLPGFRRGSCGREGRSVSGRAGVLRGVDRRLSRRRFLAGASAATLGAAWLAACGDDGDPPAPSATASSSSPGRRAALPVGHGIIAASGNRSRDGHQRAGRAVARREAGGDGDRRLPRTERGKRRPDRRTSRRVRLAGWCSTTRTCPPGRRCGTCNRRPRCGRSRASSAPFDRRH